MAKKKNDLVQWGILVAAAAGLYYLYKKGQPGTAATSITTTTTTTPVAALPTTQAAAVLDPGVSPPITQTVTPESLAPLTTTVPTSNATHSANQQTVIDFFTSDLDEANLNQFNNSMAQFTTQEWASLYDLLVNDWEGGGGNTPARKQFWDTWRVKYHILDGTYN